ncbi:MAG: hypothetical protein ACYSUI_11000, partial [Planctomycetota bacterium]
LGQTGTCTATVTVEDNTPPTIDPEAGDMAVECDGVGNVDDLSAWLDSHGGAVASDACGGLTWSDDFAGSSDDCGATGETTVTFTATDECENASTTSAAFTIVDGVPPSITCPAGVTVTCPEASDPAATGAATATDFCDDDPAYPAIAYNDVEEWPSCLADPIMYDITRTWTATDECGNPSACDQAVGVLKAVRSLIVKQGACPAPLNRNSHGVLPVLLTGDLDFDVAEVDLSTVRLSRADCVGGAVAPNAGPPGPGSRFKDLNHPYTGEAPCSCNEYQTPDGITDLSMKFRTDDLVEGLELNDLLPGAIVELVLTGTLLDGCGFMAGDCVRLIPPGTPLGMLSVESTAPGAWIDVGPLDETLDGGGFASFERSFPLTTVVTLTAEPKVDGQRFVGWLVNGVMHNAGQSNGLPEFTNQSPAGTTIQVTTVENETVMAVYSGSLSPIFGPTIQQPSPEIGTGGD